jgi:uncharacterized protein (UPF0548 family)
MTWTYDEVGATRTGVIPPGYRSLRVRHRIGHGDLGLLGEALLIWRVHAVAGVPVEASAGRAAPGVDAEARIGVGPLRLPAPCRVVWVEAAEDRVAFAYGTLPGHPFVGEESFAVERDGEGDLWFVAAAFSRPNWWAVRMTGPVAPALQRLYLARLAGGARRLASPETPRQD